MYVATDRNQKRIEAAIHECFGSDAALLSRWHIAAPAPLEACVARTLKDISAADSSFRFHRVYDCMDLVGYWGEEGEGTFLNLIFLKPEFRTKAVKTAFWDSIVASMKPNFATAVYARNTPAVRFYLKRCTRAVSINTADGSPAVAFKFSREPKDKVS